MSVDFVRGSRHEQDRKRRAAIDKHVGARIRLRRNNVGVTTETLADVLGIRYQQINYYEAGKNRVSASSLYLIAEILDVPVSFFFDEMPDYDIINDVESILKKIDRLETLNIFSVSEIDDVENEVRAVAHLYYLIESSVLRKGILDFIRLLGRELQTGTAQSQVTKAR